MTPEEFVSVTGVTPDIVEDLRAYRDLIVDWNSRINLVGPSFETDFWRRHALDSWQLFHVEQRASTWADIGAGAGFPGVVLAILLKTRAGAKVRLVESLGKRVRFLEAVSDALQLPVEIHHGRAENLNPAPRVEVVTARACAPLPRLLAYTQAFFARGAYGLFLKGKAAPEEVAEARRSWTFTAELLPSLSDPSGRLLRVTTLAARG